jgi:hypothetical protein
MSNSFLISYREALNKLKSSNEGIYIPHLSTNNAKLKTEKIASFGLVAGVTCPAAAECNSNRFCYAQNGRYVMPQAMSVRVENFLASKQNHFVSSMIVLLKSLPKNWLTIRLHDSGDFYSQEYIDKWEQIISQNKDKFFYAYTKSLNLNLEKLISLKNALIIQSEGGKFDNKINYKMPHAKIFKSEEELLKSGYVNASNSDLRAIKSIKIGLIIHGLGQNLF